MNHNQLPQLVDFKKEVKNKKTVLIILENDRGMKVAFSNYGARIVSILVPDKYGKPVDVVLGFSTIEDYLGADEVYHGATIGRFANRIKQGKFKINEVSYTIGPNNGPNALHGGKAGFHQQIWDRRVNNPNEVTFYYTSPDNEEGFPGTLTVSVCYTLTDNNELQITYRASSDKDTIINLTNHAYFNLKGEGKGDILDHVVEINADAFVPINEQQIPLGELSPIKNSPFDFSSAKAISTDIDKTDTQLLNGGQGYDHCFVLNKGLSNGKKVVASAYADRSGVKLEILTTEPGLQFYTGNALSGKDLGKSGNTYDRHSAFCFETQHFPDSPNQKTFPDTYLKAGTIFHSQTTYRFSVIK
ncbi:galactose mutarotase [Olivibacter sp. SDN3]|uniref:aldose epimerase family protein n=1 Tax=Olivibacter sp. SDN3 TaxID=2764720 RepID=UPI001650F603|nr:aldose epimerase family protein [Olivibacter sp. SDN3]QNL51160.1 galactose mutarotase [Olivibacter sp. SDN3]